MASFFTTTLHFEDAIVTASREFDDPNEVEYSYTISYRNYFVFHHGAREDIKWLQGNLTEDQKKELTKDMVSILPDILEAHMGHNSKFSEAFDKIDEVYRKPAKIIAALPNLINRKEYYFSIKHIPYYGFSINKVVIQGVLNVESFDMNKDSQIFTQSIQLKDIHGNMELTYGSARQAPLQLIFIIDYLTLSIKEGTDLAHVEAYSYTIKRLSGLSLRYRQLATMMEELKLAMVAAFLPSKRAWKKYNMAPEIGQIQVTNTSNWKQIEKMYRNWIPFNNEVDIVERG